MNNLAFFYSALKVDEITKIWFFIDADDDYITMNENHDVIRKFVRSNTVETILHGDIYDSYNADGYSVSSTGQYIFLRYNYQKVIYSFYLETPKIVFDIRHFFKSLKELQYFYLNTFVYKFLV